MATVFGYGRGSTEEQIETLGVQTDACTREYEYRYKPLGFLWGGMFLDRGVSGATRFKKRPEGLRLSLQANRDDVIIITKLDRGFRSASDFLEMMDDWARQAVRLRLLDLDLDTGTPIGRMLAVILAAVAEFERLRICERTREVKRRQRAQGRPTGGTPPFGWKVVGPKNAKRYVPDTSDREAASRFLTWYEAGWTYERIYWHLIRERVKRPDGREYSLMAIKRRIWYERALRSLEAEGYYEPAPVSRLIKGRVKELLEKENQA